MPRNRSPLKEQAFRLGGVGVAAVVGVILLVLLPSVFGGSRRIPTVLLFVPGIFVLIVVVAGTPVALLVGRRLVGDRIEVAMRVPNEQWRHGRLTASPGHLSFQPYAFQVRIPSGPPIEFDVSQLGEDVGRGPGLRQIWKLNPQLHIITLNTDLGVRELGALPSRIQEIRERLNSSNPSTPSAAG